MSLAQCNMTALTQNGVDAFVRNVCNQPHQVSRLLKCIEKAPVGAVLIVESAGIANNGAQYHCGSLTSSARIFSRLDVTCTRNLLKGTFYTTACARFFDVKPAILGACPTIVHREQSSHRVTYFAVLRRVRILYRILW